MTKDQLKQLEDDLWRAADNLRANSELKSSEYSTPVLGLIFLKCADNNYRRYEAEILAEYQQLKGTRREKKNGEIIDYYNVFRNMRKALKDYAQGREGQEEPPVQEKKVLFSLLDDAITQGKEFRSYRV